MTSTYDDVPLISFSLEEFTLAANELYASEEYGDFIRLVLFGEFVDANGNRKRVFVDPLRGAADEHHPLTISRDYDTAIGISQDILVDGPISVFAVPHPTLALKSSIHMKHTIEYKGVSQNKIFVHLRLQLT